MSVRRNNCSDCGASGNDVHISRSGLCPECGDRRQRANTAAMVNGEGFQYDAWMAGMAAAAARAARRAEAADAALQQPGHGSRSAAPPEA